MFLMLQTFYVLAFSLQRVFPLNVPVSSDVTRYLINRPWTDLQPGHDQQENITSTTESEIILQRQKRQDTSSSSTDSTVSTAATPPPAASPPANLPNTGTPGFACSVELYQRINKLCCNLPSLIDDSAVSKCNKVSNFLEGQMSVPSNPGLRNMQLKRFILRRNLQVVNRNITSLTVSQICLIQCVFKQLRWLNRFDVVDETYMKSYLAIQLPSVWGTRLENARLECASLLTTDPGAFVTNQFGMKCLIAPSKYIRCVKRHLMMFCENKISDDKKCQLDNVKLSACDINTL